ncbi:cucumber peeling cupredoxin-like [Momordica charantia]|uniref:Cucumber peeling cupredoxin-like n=1 Tax=Momordica charantia TaxID=3673 RepID=A0A6J1DC50_MOMCH|nr:cucumber peeling cupredoxin-like [Momordica charantia]
MAGGVIALVLGFVAAVLAQQAAAQTVHVVGDATGWTVPQGGATFYSDWAARRNFVAGDSLTFTFGTNAHDVLEVTKESFDACSSDNAIGNVITTGPATVKLNAAGVHYYICTVGRHCLGGQKLSITVSATPGGAGPSPNTPRPPPATTPSHANDDACAPAGSPSSSPPNGGGSQSAPPPSSSSAVMASIFVTLSAIVMSFC